MKPLPYFNEVLTQLISFNNGDVDAAERLEALRSTLHASEPGLAPGQYPELDDKDFHKRLQRIRDLYVIDDPASVLRSVGATGRPLTKAQRFVTAYMHPRTGYNGMLLVHAVGTGKTACAVSVAELYRAIMAKSALVLTKGNVRNEFVKELGNPDAAKYGPAGWTMPVVTVGTAYQKVLSSIKTSDPERMRETMEKVIRKNYTFQGYESFANAAQRAETAGGVAGLRAEYSDRVIIVDEAHSLRTDDASKRSSDLLMKILRVCTNVKLLLMTATPMYDQPREIVFLLNLLRANDKLPLLDADTLFSADGDLVDERTFREACTGYVSFVRGSNPMLYPTAIKEHVAKGVQPDVWPKHRMDGSPVPHFDQTGTALVRTELVGEQAELIIKLRSKSCDDDQTTALAPVAQASNIAYPTSQGPMPGEKGLNALFASRLERGVLTFSYRDHVQRALSQKELPRCAPKIARVVDGIIESQGIQFIYSNWLAGGAIPLALALEERGIVRYGSAPLLTNPSTQRKVIGKYIFMTGKAELMENAAAALREVNKKGNMRGNRIKVVIASSAAMEGVNFFCIRDVHLLDGWWNLSRPLQVVGRALRMLSHGALEPEERNVTLHYHAASLPGDREGIDHHMYRVATIKQQAISRVLRILRDESVDCAWNSATLYRAPTGKSLHLKTSLGKVITIPEGNRDGDAECFFGACTKPCKHLHLLAPSKLNNTLFKPLADDLELMRLVIETLFRTRKRLLLKDIVAAVPGVEPDLAKLCVRELLEHGVKMHGMKGRGRFAMYGRYFMVDVVAKKDVVVTTVALADDVEDPRSADVDIMGEALEFAKSAFPMSGKGKAAFPSIPGFASQEVQTCAIAAVIDRMGFAELRRASQDRQMYKHLVDGGYIRKNDAGRPVLVLRSRAEFLNGNAEPTQVPTLTVSAKQYTGTVTEAGVFKLTGSLRGRTCTTLSSPQIEQEIAKLTTASVAAVEKIGKCAALELLMRKQGTVERPGLAHHVRVV